MTRLISEILLPMNKSWLLFRARLNSPHARAGNRGTMTLVLQVSLASFFNARNKSLIMDATQNSRCWRAIFFGGSKAQRNPILLI